MKKIDKKYLTLIKYIFCMIFPLGVVLLRHHSWLYAMVALLEVLIIAAFTNILLGWNKILGFVFNVLAVAVINSQFAILFWANSFTSMVMLNNLGSLDALSGKGLEYTITFILVFVFSVLPVCYFQKKKEFKVITAVIAIGLCAMIYVTGLSAYSPYYGIYELGIQYSVRRNAENAAEQTEKDGFYNPEVLDYIEKPDVLPETPNIILIFTEGLSKNIIEDTRNVMPHMQKLQEQTICFEDYYNHTFATYMGLSGQLYSGYQKENLDANYLISLQDIFKDYGYQTAFINTEPENQDFTNYLKGFCFDTLVNDISKLDGTARSLSDKTAYELLLATAETLNNSENPFFLSMYTFGTHVSLDGIYEKYGDGTDTLLNRFYDVDVQIGTFIEAFQKSDLCENTIVIFTADHATYEDSSFTASYPDYSRKSTMLDRIPLMIYYKGLEPQKWNAEGRNSLDLAPTILDFLDMTGENYFLGESLFSPVDNNSIFDTYFESLSAYYNTAGGEIRTLSMEELSEISVEIAKYFALKLNESNYEQNIDDTVHIGVKDIEEKGQMKVEVLNAQDYSVMSFAIWSEDNGQDDLTWHAVESTQENYMTFTIDLSEHDAVGIYNIHLYCYDEAEPVLLAGIQIDIEP